MPLAYINFVSGGHPDQGLPPGSPGMPDQGLPGSQPGIDNSLPTPPPGLALPPVPTHPIQPAPPGTPPGAIWPRRRAARPVQGLPGSPGHPSQGLPGAPPHPSGQPVPTPPPTGGTPPQPSQPIATPPTGSTTPPPSTKPPGHVLGRRGHSRLRLAICVRRPPASTLACRCHRRHSRSNHRAVHCRRSEAAHRAPWFRTATVCGMCRSSRG